MVKKKLVRKKKKKKGFAKKTRLLKKDFQKDWGKMEG